MASLLQKLFQAATRRELTPFYLTPSIHELRCFEVNQGSVEPYVHSQVGEHEGELGPGVLHEEAGQGGEGDGGEPEAGAYLGVGVVFLGGVEVHLGVEEEASVDQGVQVQAVRVVDGVLANDFAAVHGEQGFDQGQYARHHGRHG